MTIRPVGAEMFNADGQVDRRTGRRIDKTKLIVTFRNFTNAHIRESLFSHQIPLRNRQESFGI